MMTDDKIALREVLEKGSDAGFLREMIGFAAERLMSLETDELCGFFLGAVDRSFGSARIVDGVNRPMSAKILNIEARPRMICGEFGSRAIRHEQRQLQASPGLLDGRRARQLSQSG